MKLWSDSFQDGQPIPAAYALGKPNPDTHVELSDNVNPHLAWSDLPEGTKSLALICDDLNCPTSPDNVNKEGVTVPADLRRTDFYHWALVDLSTDAAPITEGEFSRGVTAKGKDSAQGPRGTRQGLNNYTQWFEGDAEMAGNYIGYDGPCPPWNDELVHHYHFTLYRAGRRNMPGGRQLRRPDGTQSDRRTRARQGDHRRHVRHLRRREIAGSPLLDVRREAKDVLEVVEVSVATVDEQYVVLSDVGEVAIGSPGEFHHSAATDRLWLVGHKVF